MAHDVKPDGNAELAAIQREKLREVLKRDDALPRADSRSEDEILGHDEHGIFFFSSRRRHTRLQGDWSSDVCSSDLIREAGGQLHIGATASHYDVESSALLRQKCPLLTETAAAIGDVQVRNMGTIGGDRKSVV